MAMRPPLGDTLSLLLLMGASCLPAMAQTPTSPQALASKASRACRADFDRFCKGTQPGQGRVLACLRGHRNDLTESCRLQLDQH